MLTRILCALSLATLLGACGDDAPATIPECEEIVEACHSVDTGSGEIHECHEGAEAATTAQTCIDMRTSCLAACLGAQDAGVADGPATTSDASR